MGMGGRSGEEWAQLMLNRRESARDRKDNIIWKFTGIADQPLWLWVLAVRMYG